MPSLSSYIFRAGNNFELQLLKDFFTVQAALSFSLPPICLSVSIFLLFCVPVSSLEDWNRGTLYTRNGCHLIVERWSVLVSFFCFFAVTAALPHRLCRGGYDRSPFGFFC